MALAMQRNNFSLNTKDPVVQDEFKEPKPRTAEKREKKLQRQGSVSENFFAVTNASLILPKTSDSNEPVEGMKSLKFGGDLKTHLYAIIAIVRPQDRIKLAARLESWEKDRVRYLVIVTTIGRQDTEESIILGIDFMKNEHKSCTIGLTIPVWSDMIIQLDGDGGFEVSCRDKEYTFKPVSVQALWSALQNIHRCLDIARQNNYYYGSLFLTWTCYYESRVLSSRLFMNEWEYIDDLWSRRPDFYADPDPQRKSIEMQIRGKLKEVMMKMDLDNCNSKDIRQALERCTDLNLKEYKTYIDTEMLVILGQMDTASEILDFLYLGSAWNASNIEELTDNGITHILNITMEIDNFHPDCFTYKNIRCYDEITTDLLHVWNDTWKFIKQAQKSHGKCLVHCKMGISRSAATVTSFIMKENLWSKDKALSFVKERRPIVCPNEGFMRQLHEYEGIIFASAQRHNVLFRSYSESNLSVEHAQNENENTMEHRKLSTEPPVDFNRQLLDLASLVYRPSHRRAKSWSPGERKFYDPDDLTSGDCFEATSIGTAPLSEPNDMSRHSSTDSKVTGDKDIKGRNWRRRHTEKIINFRDFDLNTRPQSEDSVFVHPGVKTTSWNEATMVGLREAWSVPIPTSPKKEELQVKPNVHSSLASPMNSPSFKCTKHVNVSALKSHFNEQSTMQINELDGNVIIVQMEQEDIITPLTSAEKSASLLGDNEGAQPVKETRAQYGRSMSDSQVVNVKTVVSDIESKYGDGRSKHTRNASMDSATQSGSSIADKNANSNNNNNVVSEQDFVDGGMSVADKRRLDFSKSRSLTQSELQVIREVGMTFIGEMTLDDTESVGELSEDSNASHFSTSDNGSISSFGGKERGIVRKMARLIESRIKRQMGATSGSLAHFISHTDSAERGCSQSSPSNSANAVINPPDVIVQERNVSPKHGGVLLNRNGADLTPYAPSTFADLDQISQTTTSLRTREFSPSMALMLPTPYHADRTLPEVSKVEFRNRQSVRRSHSERSFNLEDKKRQFSRYKTLKWPRNNSDSADNDANFPIKSRDTKPESLSQSQDEEHKQKVTKNKNKDVSREIRKESSENKDLISQSSPSIQFLDDGRSQRYSKRGWMSRDNCLYQTI